MRTFYDYTPTSTAVGVSGSANVPITVGEEWFVKIPGVDNIGRMTIVHLTDTSVVLSEENPLAAFLRHETEMNVMYRIRDVDFVHRIPKLESEPT